MVASCSEFAVRAPQGIPVGLSAGAATVRRMVILVILASAELIPVAFRGDVAQIARQSKRGSSPPVRATTRWAATSSHRGEWPVACSGGRYPALRVRRRGADARWPAKRLTRAIVFVTSLAPKCQI
jgi:hypothetical protein